MPRRKKSTRSRPSRRNRSEFFSDRRRQQSRAKGHPFVGRQLYDLAGAEAERRFSPYCWRAKMALMHKGLPFDTIPWRFNEKSEIAPHHKPLRPLRQVAIWSDSDPRLMDGALRSA